MKRIWLYSVLGVILLTTSVVYAKTITVDGDGSEWEVIEIVIDDANNDGGGGGQDIDVVYVTNDATNAYFRVDTVGLNDIGASILFICLDTDNDTGTGINVGGCDIAGVDRGIVIDLSEQCPYAGPLSLLEYPSANASAPPSLNQATNTNITEIEIALSELVIADGTTVPMGVFINSSAGGCSSAGADLATGAATFGTGSPTAVTLQSADTNLTDDLPIILILILSTVSLTVILKKPTNDMSAHNGKW